MTATPLMNWLKKLWPDRSRRQRPRLVRSTNRGAPRWRPMVEVLEDRLTPSVVTDTGDSSTDTGSLRYAIANTPSGGTITFDPSLSGDTITLTSTLTLSHNVTITGLGAENLAISGGGTVEVYSIATGITASISGLTIENGNTSNYGGGVINTGTLTLTADTLSGNFASHTGGAIYNYGGHSLTVINSTISGNNATSSGGGINNFGTLVLRNSTVFGNTTTDYYGAGIYNAGTATLISDTVSDNSAGTFGFCGGVLNFGTATLDNTIVAGNNAPTDPDAYGTYSSSNYNLIGNTSGNTVSGTGNHLNINGSLASSLAYNGGPTRTLALMPGSAALGVGDPGQSGTTSQNGVIRPATPDIGAYQTPLAPMLTSINPTSALVGSSNTTITLTGSNFISISTADFNGTALNTTYLSPTSLTAVIPAADLTTPANDAITVVTPGPGGGTSSAVTFTVAPATFQVTSTTLLPGDNGFLVTFNAPYNISQLSLYTGDSGHVLTTRSVQITGPSGATIFGGTGADTLRFNAVPVNSTQLELILTGLTNVAAAPVLPAGNYTVTLEGGSGNSAFERLSDSANLDGNGDGTIQVVDNYIFSTLTVTAIPASTDMVTIGDLVAGPGQTLPVPLVLSGGSGSVSDTTAISLTIAPPADGAYTVTGFTVNSAITGITANFTPATGVLTLSSATPFSMTDSPLLLGTFTIAVDGLGNPGTAPAIDTKTPIDITATSVLDHASNPKPFVVVNGFHVSAFPGNFVVPVGTLNATAVSQLQGIVITSVRAFALYPNVDPMLLADVNRDGSVNSTDVAQLQARVLGLPSSIPAMPAGANGIAINGADPVLFVGSAYTRNGQPADLGSLTPGSTVLVPLSVFVTDPDGVNVSSAEAAFSFDPKMFTLHGVTAGAIANGSLGGSPFAVAFTEESPGEVKVIGSSSSGPSLGYGQTATLFVVSLTVRPDAPMGATVFNLMNSEDGFQTGLQDNKGRNLVLSPAPDNRAGDNLDGAFTVQNGMKAQPPVEVPVGTTATGNQKLTDSARSLPPAAWELLTTLLFQAVANQAGLNGSNGDVAVSATVPVTAATEGEKQAGQGESLQGVPWEQLTTDLFKDGANEMDLNGNPTTPLRNL